MTILSIFLIIVCILLVLVVLSQNSKGGGLSGQFGGNANTSQILGAKRTGDFLEKATWVLITLLFLGSFLSSKTVYIEQENKKPKSIINQIKENIIDPTLDLDEESAFPPDSTDITNDVGNIEDEDKKNISTDNKSVSEEETAKSTVEKGNSNKKED